MEQSLIPQNAMGQSQYRKLLSKLNSMFFVGEKQSFRLIYENVHENLLGYSWKIYAPNCTFLLKAEIVCKSCNNFHLPLRRSLFLCNVCQNVAYLKVAIQNLGDNVKVLLDIGIEMISDNENDLEKAHIQNVAKYLKKNETYYVEWKFVDITAYGPVIFAKSENNIDKNAYVYGNAYFSEMGNLTILFDVKFVECQGNAEVEFLEPPSILTTLAEQFSKANINPATPPDDLLTDVILCIGENKIYCHKMVLGMSSNFFKKMFTTNMKESKSQEIELKDVEVNLETIENMINFMYGHRIDDVKITTDLLAVADMYDVFRLRNLCSEKLKRTLDDENVAEIWFSAYTHNIEELTHAATIFMVKRWKVLSNDGGVRELCQKYPNLLFTISTLLAEYQDSMAANYEKSDYRRTNNEQWFMRVKKELI